MERLQKVIASSGVTSRRKAEELILEGKVKVNGVVVNELGTKVSSKDDVEVSGVSIKKEDKVYYLLNKPRGVVTTTKDEFNRPTVIDLIDDNRRVYPVGRLDYDTTGALILTNDGDLANRLIHPKNEIDKVYVVKVKGIPSPSDLMKLKKGVIIDGFKTSKSRVKLRKTDKKTGTAIVEITIHEGKYHQVKRMFETVNLEVLKLKRERIAFLDLKGLTSGEYRRLTPKEVSKLYNETENYEQKN